MLTGAFTGAVDAPLQVWRTRKTFYARNPIYWPFTVALFVPLGIAVGPLAGLGKGLAIDIEWLLDQIGYPRVFTTYKDASIWRPYTIHW
jgi:hypothetical protein